MGRHKDLDQERVYNSVIKIINTSVILDIAVPYNIQQQTQSVGAGFFFNNEGYAITAAHVLENSVELWIKLPKYGQKIFRGEIVCVYPDFDIGIIRVKDIKNNSYLELGNSDDISLRDRVYTIGYPRNPKYPIITSGTISGKREEYIQTDTPVNPGNSGGPLLDENNMVIGITSAVIAQSEDSSLIIPINIVNQNLESMMNSKTKTIQKNVLGTLLVNGTANYKDLYNIPEQCAQGIVVKQILEKSPLYNIIKPGDMICSFSNGEKEYKIDYYGETNVEWETAKVPLDHLVKRCIPRQMVKIKFFSLENNKVKTHKFKLKTYDEIYPIKKIFPYIDKIDYEIFAGMIVMDLTINHLTMPKFMQLVHIINNGKIFKPQLVITHIFPNSKIAEYNTIAPYTLISKINNIPVNSLAEFRKAVQSPIKNKNNYYIIIETDDKNKVILNTKELIKQEEKLSKDYNYENSSIIDYLVDLF